MADRSGNRHDLALERIGDRFQGGGFFRFGTRPIGGARPLGIAQLHRVVAKHRHRPRHGADLVAAAGTVDRHRQVASRHQAHRARHALQRQRDKELRQ